MESMKLGEEKTEMQKAKMMAAAGNERIRIVEHVAPDGRVYDRRSLNMDFDTGELQLLLARGDISEVLNSTGGINQVEQAALLILMRMACEPTHQAVLRQGEMLRKVMDVCGERRKVLRDNRQGETVTNLAAAMEKMERAEKAEKAEKAEDEGEGEDE